MLESHFVSPLIKAILQYMPIQYISIAKAYVRTELRKSTPHLFKE